MDLCKLTKLGTIGAVAALLAASQTTAFGQVDTTRVRTQGSAQGSRRAPAQGDGHHALTFQTTKDGRNIAVEIRDGRIVSATLDGDEVPQDRIKTEDNKFAIVDEDGETIFEMNQQGQHTGRLGTWFGPDDRMVFSGPGTLRGLQGIPAVQAEPPPVMIGASLAEPDRGLRHHFGLEEGKATMLQAVYDDLPAARAGLKPYDIIVSVDGDDDAGQNNVREALRDAEGGDTITFGVIQNGQRKDVRVKLEKYDEERLTEAARKYREEHGDEEGVFQFGFPFGEGQGQHLRWFTPGAPEEFNRQFFQGEGGERLRRLQQEQGQLARELREQLERTPRPRGAAPRAGQGGGEQLDRLEDRLDRLERMLEKLAEAKDGR